MSHVCLVTVIVIIINLFCKEKRNIIAKCIIEMQMAVTRKTKSNKLAPILYTVLTSSSTHTHTYTHTSQLNTQNTTKPNVKYLSPAWLQADKETMNEMLSR